MTPIWDAEKAAAAAKANRENMVGLDYVERSRSWSEVWWAFSLVNNEDWFGNVYLVLGILWM